jgi:ABC-2 type transport system ATP-binding protein
MSVLELVEVTKRYAKRTALSDVSLDLEEGSTLGLLGPNGAGKTTLLRLLLGFCRASRGQVRLRGKDPSQPEARRSLGYLPERLALPERATVQGLLKLHGRLAGLEPSSLATEVAQTMDRVGVADRASDRIGGLSKGLRQRVGFAQALLGSPEILLLDEPTSGLDPIGVRDAREWIASARARGCTVLVSSHVLSEVERTCDRVAVLHEGKVLASGALQEVVGDAPNLEAAFVELVDR